MRMLLRVSIPVDTGNAAAKAGTLGSTIEKILADLKPEAAYFFADDNGQRSGSIVFDMKDSSAIPAIAEPWFLAFNASIEIHPVMVPDDLAKAGSAIEAAVNKYPGKRAYEAALKAAHVTYEGYLYPNAVHGFNNDATPERYNKAAADLAWQRTIDHFNKTLKS